MSAEVALRRTLRALLDDLTEVCSSSYAIRRNGHDVWNDSVWLKADPHTFRLALKARAALALPPATKARGSRRTRN